jgi:hypothetical protein
LSGWAGLKDSAGGKVTDLSATLVAVSNWDEIAGKPRLWIIIGANRTAWALAVGIAGTSERTAAIGNALATVVARANTRTSALAHAICIIAATRCTGITEEVTIFSRRALNVLCTFSRAVWETYWRVVVIGAGKSGWAIAVVAWVGIYTIGLFANETVRSTIELVVARW